MKKVMVVFGTRPEAIKMAPLVKEFQRHDKAFHTIVVVTAQHREMLDQVLRIFCIKPDYDLNIMKPGQDLYDITSRVMLGIRDILNQEKPDVVLVHGDTTTSMAAAISAFYARIPVGHVEAGLRTHNLYSPWPEELNRQITGRIAEFNFAPTNLSKLNLQNEGVDERKIIVTGNTVIDALHLVKNKLAQDCQLSQSAEESISKAGYKLNVSHDIVLITGHRRENFGQGFDNICRAIKTLAEKYPATDFVYPVHPNPNVKKAVDKVFGDTYTKNVYFISPLEYVPFVWLMHRSKLVLTDSGGIQEEAPGIGKPVLVMRDTTERPEAVEAGTVKLVGTDCSKIIQEVQLLLENPSYYQIMSKAVNPYGDGHACEKIVNALKRGL